MDGTHCRVQRPSEKTVRRMRYSGKKKNVHQQHQCLHQCQWGNNRDIEELCGFHRRHHVAQGRIPCRLANGRNQCTMTACQKKTGFVSGSTKGYLGTDKDLPGTNLMIPHKRSKKPQDPDCRTKGAQPPSQLYKGAGRAFYREDQALRAHD